MAGSFAKDQDAYMRSLGWGGTKVDRKSHDSYADKDQHIYDSLLKAAGDDKKLTHEEYRTIFYDGDTGPWGKTAYGFDSIANALAQLGSQTGTKLDQKTMDLHDLSYDGDDILQKVEKDWDRGPDSRKKDDFKISWERGIEDGTDYHNVFRWGSNVQEAKEEEVVEEEEEVISDPDCPDGQIRGTSGACIDDNEYAENPWEEPRKVPQELADRKNDWDTNWNPGRFVDDLSDLGSIPYYTPHMSDQYKPAVGTGKFSSFLRSKQYQQDRSN